MRTRGTLQSQLADRLGSAAEARWMVEEVLGRRGLPGAPVSEVAEAELSRMAARRQAGAPLQYVLGSWAFRGLELGVDSRALIPRPETEQVVEVALVEARRAAAGGRGAVLEVVDLGTGSGAIALAMAMELAPEHPGLEVWATDADPDALALARSNLERLGVLHPASAERVRLRSGSWFEALAPSLSGSVHVVVSNPPYVSDEEWESLDRDVRQEPRQALVAGPGSDGTPGMAAVEAVLAGALEWLATGGAAVVELSPPQAAPAVALARRLGYLDVRVERDLAGRERAVVGRR